MKNLLKFFVLVALLSIAISALYDYRFRHGRFGGISRSTPEKYTLASQPNVDSKQVASLEELSRERRVLVSSVVPSVVAVKTSKKVTVRRPGALDPFEFFFPNMRRGSPYEESLVQNSLGSGVIITKEGHIITNNHVVDQVDEIEVQLSDGRSRKARLIGADRDADLAVLKIDEPGLTPLKLADSDQVQAGDFVLAIGNPFGFEETVTEGIISSKGRPNRADVFGELLQTDAAINPGNSGGPLINLKGEVVGINTAIISGSGGSQGIGFAIPSNTVRIALESLLKRGRIIRGYLGIQSQPPAANQSNASSQGIIVDSVVPGSPAADAGLQKGDVIEKFNGHEVNSLPRLRSLVSQVEVNKNVDLQLRRDGQLVNVTARIKEMPVDYLTRNVPSPNREPSPVRPGGQNQVQGVLGGIEVDELTPEISRQLDLPKGVRGVVVTNVDADSAAPELQKGDVIEEVNQQPVSSVSEYNKVASSLDPNQAQVLSVCRHRVRSFLVLRPR